MKLGPVTLIAETGIPIPTGRRRDDSIIGQLRSFMATLKPGQSFIWPYDNKRAFKAALDLGITVTTQKTKDGPGWRVWRKS